MLQDLKIKYLRGSEKFGELKYVLEKSDWIDLRNAEDVHLKQFEATLIPLGVAIALPYGYEAILAPRSSTFSKYGILQANSIGIIDETYCGDDDEWKLSVWATRDIDIPAGTRICQFRILEHQPSLHFIKVDTLANPSRGGFGSTGEV